MLSKAKQALIPTDGAKNQISYQYRLNFSSYLDENVDSKTRNVLGLLGGNKSFSMKVD